MGIFFSGRSRCMLCGRVMQEEEELFGFPAFVADESNPMYPYSDATFHATCLRSDPLGMAAVHVVEEWRAKTGPGRRQCVVCGLEPMSHEDYEGWGFLASAGHPLSRFNFTHLHKSCVPRWKDRAEFVAAANRIIATGEWGGDALFRLVARLEKLA